VVVGLETHVQVTSTQTKAFCGCRVAYGDAPNTRVCPVCLGYPGSLPVLNAGVVDAAVRTGLALGCDVNLRSKFDRKQYFYADLPKGYQISQYDVPVCGAGRVALMWSDGEGGAVRERAVGIERLHMEEDAGKSAHGAEASTLDFNRAGVALLEIVSRPDLRGGDEAAAYAAEVQRVVRYLGVGEASPQEGSLRCDVNVSVRRAGVGAPLGTKVEVKNLNSFAAIRLSVEHEARRQHALLEAGRGDEIVQETRTWSEASLATVPMRSKEGLADYRYFPEPDLPPCVLTEAQVAQARAALPELPAQKRARYLGDLGLTPQDALSLAGDAAVATYYDGALASWPAASPGTPAPDFAKRCANWVLGDLAAACKERGCALGDLRLTPAHLGELVGLIAEGTLSTKLARDVLPDLLDGEAEDARGGPAALVAARGLAQVSDAGELEAIVRGVIDANPEQLAQFRAGKTKLKGFFVGATLKATGGKADPALANQLVDRLLGEQ